MFKTFSAVATSFDNVVKKAVQQCHECGINSSVVRDDAKPSSFITSADMVQAEEDSSNFLHQDVSLRDGIHDTQEVGNNQNGDIASLSPREEECLPWFIGSPLNFLKKWGMPLPCMCGNVEDMIDEPTLCESRENKAAYHPPVTRQDGVRRRAVATVAPFPRNVNRQERDVFPQGYLDVREIEHVPQGVNHSDDVAMHMLTGPGAQIQLNREET